LEPTDFLSTALNLLDANGDPPRETNLRRACSTAYYALFHALCRTCANTLVGEGAAQTTKRAWTQAYRALDHKFARDSCSRSAVVRKFSAEIQDFADQFVQMQEKRHRADYDPQETFYESSVRADIEAARVAIEAFETAPLEDRRAFAAYVLFKFRDT
jgi:uncharacterized protein (UPF0332 family)